MTGSIKEQWKGAETLSGVFLIFLFKLFLASAEASSTAFEWPLTTTFNIIIINTWYYYQLEILKLSYDLQAWTSTTSTHVMEMSCILG
jgi:hypothetical protein